MLQQGAAVTTSALDPSGKLTLPLAVGVYDVEVDTTSASADECAAKVMAALSGSAGNNPGAVPPAGDTVA